MHIDLKVYLFLWYVHVFMMNAEKILHKCLILLFSCGMIYEHLQIHRVFDSTGFDVDKINFVCIKADSPLTMMSYECLKLKEE